MIGSEYEILFFSKYKDLIEKKLELLFVCQIIKFVKFLMINLLLKFF